MTVFITINGTHLTLSVSDMMCFNNTWLYQPLACMDMKVHGAKGVGASKVLKVLVGFR